ncbi:cardiolipin synthase ClsB [Nitrosomonas eutropha]|uniref:Cardiolipin synthase B n=2 Tax=Nitrosomonas eutropha TaxID=916 RepID=A0ABX5M587_9PROT|nr:cardiolipin synthase ClsB [Nitrosomonas eutropha]ABI60514.1 phospholipase D/Transphosphatidylase [Nitrosomonas eutropha C91]PXV79367.1 cardiolipin synthase [Nitrosomonas eutropha]SEJ11460.1 cardiolipin synthase [Nitrosomonas eutropha]
MSLPDFVEGNCITLLHSGTEYFPVLESAIDSTRQEIYLETYIFQYDTTGIRIAEALKRAAQRGVAVHLLIDGFGSLSLPGKVIREMLAAGVRVLIYRPEFFSFRLKRSRLRRMHRKLAVMDASLAFVGGINIVDDCYESDALFPRFDYAVQIIGPLLEKIHATARHLWMLVAWVYFKKRWTNYLSVVSNNLPAGHQRASLVIRDNLRNRRSIEHCYLRAIAVARKEIIIANAYFLPGKNFRQALIKAAQRGVSVILLLQGKSEYRLQYYAMHALYGHLLDAGIRIYEYRQGYLHAKVAVIDGSWSTVGSSNIDPFSLLLAREANVIILDRIFAAGLRGSLQRTLEVSCPVLQHSWRGRSRIKRSLNWICYYFIRMAWGLLGYRRD